ncbi:MAG TPA: CAP domain-containing protein [Hyphomicrobiaceae bacterium]|nr:CAP domain-containing protein [Hyphomicrobiaceae bacterium]
MRSFVVPAVLSLCLSGCGMMSYSLTANLPSVSSGQPTGKAPRVQAASAGGFNTRVAAAGSYDRAPKGSFERASTGALEMRDYTGTHLDAEAARDLVNAYRREKGLRPLKLQPALTEAARAHSRDLAKWDRISHFGSDGSSPWDRVKRSGYRAKLAAENVGTGQASIQEVLSGWKASPGHNKNLLLPDAEHMGIALVKDPKTEFKTFWTLVVASPR